MSSLVSSSAPPAASKKEAELVAVLPASESGKWEIVRLEEGRLSTTLSEEPALRKSDKGRTVFAWSSREVITLPVWVAESGSSSEMIALELELRGLSRPGESPVLGSDEVLKANGRVLYAVHLLTNLRAECPIPTVGYCEVRSRWIAVEKDSLHFWKEQGSWIYGVTRDGILVYTEPLGSDDLSASGFAGIQRTIERFRAEGVLRDSLANVLFFDVVEPTVFEAARVAFDQPGRQLDKRLPVIPSVLLDLPAQCVTDRRAKRRQFERYRLGLLAAAAGVGLLAIIGGIGLLKNYQELKTLEARIAGQTDEVSRLIGIARNWQVIEPAVEPKFYPLDILRDCAAQLPEAGTRFTAVTFNGPEILIQGEAVTHPAAFQFAENLKKATALAGYDWEVPQPTMLPNNTASFQMSGVRKFSEKPKP